MDLASRDGEDVGGQALSGVSKVANRKRGVTHGNDLDVGAVGRGSGGDGTIGSDGKSRECLDGEGGVAGWARGDESRGDRVDLVEVEGSVLGTGPTAVLLDGRVEPSLVTSLSGEDGPGNGDVGLLGDELSGSEVSRDTAGRVRWFAVLS